MSTTVLPFKARFARTLSRRRSRPPWIFCAMGILVVLAGARGFRRRPRGCAVVLLARQLLALDFQAASLGYRQGLFPRSRCRQRPILPAFRPGCSRLAMAHHIAADGKHLFTRFVQTFGLAHLLEDPRFCRGGALPLQNRLVPINRLSPRSQGNSRAAYRDAMLNTACLPCGPIIDGRSVCRLRKSGISAVAPGSMECLAGSRWANNPSSSSGHPWLDCAARRLEGRTYRGSSERVWL